ncbi:MAG: hypothetical protein JKY66_08180 [Spongiibacteraceae bacterium]|nr:hypothetical protein [Spongiibacteraceae bacterium]
MPINSTTLTPQNYSALLYDIVKQFEEAGHENPNVYLDTENIPTMGVGFNLEVTSNVEYVLEHGFGIDPTDTNFRAAVTAITNVASTYTGGSSGLQAAFDTAFQTATGSTDTFVIVDSTGQTANEKIRIIFNNVSQARETLLDGRLSAAGITGLMQSDMSNERLALMSLEYNNGNTLITNELLGHLSSGDRTAAWFYIRYNLNGNPRSISNRRYVESAVFGLFNGGAPTDVEAASIVDYLTNATNLATMQSDEIDYPSSLAASNWNFDGATLALVQNKISITKTLLPMSGYLMGRYIQDPEIAASVAGTNFSNVVLGLTGLDATRPDRIAVFQHRQAGVGKNDLLINVKNEEAILSGGHGNDVMIGNAQSDTMYGLEDNDI